LYILSAELTKAQFRLFFWRFCPLGCDIKKFLYTVKEQNSISREIVLMLV